MQGFLLCAISANKRCAHQPAGTNVTPSKRSPEEGTATKETGKAFAGCMIGCSGLGQRGQAAAWKRWVYAVGHGTHGITESLRFERPPGSSGPTLIRAVFAPEHITQCNICT